MKQHTNQNLRRALSLFMTVLLIMSCLTAAFGVISFAAADSSTLVGRYFSTSSYTYDAVTKSDGVVKVDGGINFSHHLGMTYFNRGYARLTNENLFADVTRDTGVTFAFNWRPAENERYRHVLSIGQNDAGNTRNHLFVSGARTQHHDNLVQVTWVNGSGAELINAYAADLPQVIGKEYNIVVSIDKENGVVFYLDGVKKNTVYVNSDLNGQIGNVRSFLDEVHNYKQNFVGRSRWNDPALMGYLSDLRIYKAAASDAEAAGIVLDMATVTKQFNGDGALLGRYFSTSNVWYDAARGENGVQWQAGDYPSYHTSDDWTYFNNSMYVRLSNENLFADVTRDTGLTFAFDYVPSFTGQHRHIFSLGQNEYGNGTENQFFISGTDSWYSSGKMPVVAWMNGGSEVIRAYPDGVTPEEGKEYSIVVSIDKDAGVVFYVDGVKKNTVYVDSNLNGQLGNIRGFLDAVHNYKQNYIGCSRWTADAKIDGLLRDVCIYKDTYTENEISAMLADRSSVTVDLNKPVFDAKAYHSTNEATGAYANLAYASYDDTIFSNEQAVGSQSFKIVTPRNSVMVYDGVHETYSPIELEARCNNNTAIWDHYIYYVASTSNLLPLKQNWQGYHDGGGDQRWLQWAGYATDRSFASYEHSDSSNRTDNQNNTGTSRFWWNALKYSGTGNTDTYYDQVQNISFNCWTSYYQMTSFSTHQIYGTVNSENNYYILYYKPVYDILDGASATNSSAALNADAWMYTEASLAQAKLAMRRLTLSNPKLYDYEFRGADNATRWCAAAIKQAVADYAAINLVKKTGTATFNYEDATLLQNVTADYGDTFSVPAVPAKASTAQYDYINPVWTPAIPASPVMSDTYNGAIYTATYTPSLRSYDVTWNYKTADGDQSTTTSVTYGVVPTAPAQATGDYEDADYTYSFNGWDRDLEAVTAAGASYTAQYEQTEKPDADYTAYEAARNQVVALQALIEDEGLQEELDLVIVYADDLSGYADPFKADYVDPDSGETAAQLIEEARQELLALLDEIADNDGEGNYTLKEFTITWVNEGETIDTTTVTFGSLPAHDPVTSSDAQYTYTSVGWDPEIEAAVEDTEYTAVYDKDNDDYRTVNSYPVTITAGDNTTLTVKNGDTVISSGAELSYGTVLTIEAAPAAAYSQSSVVIKVNGEALTGSTCTVTGTTNITTDAIDAANINTYTVTWVVNNETVETDENVTHGTLPSYDGETPTKSDAQYTYSFAGWDGNTEAPITADTIFTAQFSDEGTVNSYKIKFVYVPEDTETVTTSDEETLDYGAEITFPATAASYRDKADVKTFTKWIDSAGNEVDPASTTVSGNETYTAFYDTETGTARYTRTVIAVLGEEEYTTLYQNNNMQYGWASALSIDPPEDIRKEAQIWRFRTYSDGVYPGLAVPVLGDETFYAYFDLTDEAAKYTVTFLNDDNYSKIAEAEYEYGAAVNVPAETPVSTNRTKELDYTFLGWTPQVSETVTADVTYVATYETEAHSRIYPAQFVRYTNDGQVVVKEDAYAYDYVLTAEDIPADQFFKDDDVTHDKYSWSSWNGYAVSNSVNYGTTVITFGTSRDIERHVGTPAYTWVGNDQDGYTACIAAMTCTDCGEELRVEYTLDEDDVYTHTSEHCQDQSYTTYRAWIAGSGVNSYFENKVTTVYGAYGDHFYPSSSNAVVWNTEDVNNVTCKVTQTCHYCGHVEEHPGVVSPYEQTPATCATPEKTIFVAEFDGWVDQYSDEIVTAPINPNAHNYDGWNVRPDDGRSTRPAYDAETDTWSKGTLVIPCANTYTLDHDYDPETGAMTTTFHYTVDGYAAHDKVLTDLDRADYEAFDEALEKFRTIGALDIADDTVVYAETYGDETYETTFGDFKDMYFDRMLASAEQFPQNLVTIPEGASGHEFDEQPQVDAMTEQMQMTLELFFNEDGTVKEELLNKYTVTFTAADGTVTTYADKIKGAEVNVPVVPAEIDGCAFLGWTADGSEIAIPADTATYTVTGNAAFTAKYADTPDSYTVTFIVDGETVKTEPVSHGGSATAPEQAQYINNGENHKKFSGWIGDYTNVTADVTITATYEPEAHSWVDGDITKEPTCSEKGTQAQSCVCGATNVKELDEDASNHANYGTETVGAVEAKCNADGYTGDVRCVRCHAVLETGTVISRDTVAHTPGTPTEAVIQPATCGEAGSKKVTVTCTVCGVTISETTEEIPATGSHSWGWVTDTDADCGNAGVKHEECAVCHETRSEGTVIPATGNHTPGEPARENEVPATCSAEGSYVEVITCTVCGEELSRTTRTIEKKAHTPGDPTRENEKAATCTEAVSYVEVIACTVCGDVISRTNKTEGSALDHDFGDWSQTVAPTCDGVGQESRTCARCTLTETRPVAKLGHAWGEWTVTREATCTETGTKTRTCGNDPAHTETETIPMIAHTDADGDNVCDNCGATIKQPFRCGMCPTYEKYKEVPVVGWFVIVIHFFVHLAQQISHWT